MKKKYYKGLSLILVSAMVMAGVAGCASVGAAEDAKDEAEEAVTDAVTQAVQTQKTPSDKESFKEETVYVFTDAYGSQKSVTVYEKLNNPQCADVIEDETTLTNLVNLSGEEDYSENGNNIEWNALGNDITYQGDTNKKPPVDIKVTYYLDGKEISPADLAGKSGNVRIRFDYTNNEQREVEINGETKTMYVPFTAVTGMLLSGDRFSNIEVTNGKVTEVGDNYLAAGIVLPGMEDSLADKLDELEITMDIPDYFEVSADVNDFALDTVITAVTANVSADIDMGEIDTTALEDKLGELQDATDKLSEGTDKLADGTGKLADNLPALITGAGDLQNGANSLRDGAFKIKDGVAAYTDGVAKAADGAAQISGGTTQVNTAIDKLSESVEQQIVPGVTQLADGANALNDGVNQFMTATVDGLNAGEAGAVNTANAQLAASEELTAALGYTVTMDNIDETIAALEAKRNMLQAELILSDDEALQHAVAAGVKAALLQQGLEEGSDAYNAAFETQVGQQIQNMSLEQNAQLRSATIMAYRSAVSEQAKSLPSLDTAIESLKEAKAGVNGAQSALEGVKTSLTGNEDVKKLTDGAVALADGANALKAGVGTFNQDEMNEVISSGNNTVCTALYQINSGVDTLDKGTTDLSNGLNTLRGSNNDLNGGVATLADGTVKLADGTAKLKAATDTLGEGVGELNAGAVKLNNGMLEFNAEGVSKISGVLDENSDTLVAEFKEIVDLGKGYTSFAGKSDDYDGSVLFIYKMDGIE